MLGDGRGVDLYKLFTVVKGKGGYDAVCDRKLWDLVALESGLDLSVGSSVKLIYSKYLGALDSWLKKVGGCGDGEVPADYALVDSRVKFIRQLMELHNEFAGLLEDYTNENNEAGGAGGVGVGSEEFMTDVDECPDGREVSHSDGVESVGLEPGGDKRGENGGHRDMEMMGFTVNESVLGKLCKGGDDDAMPVLAEFGGGKVPAKAAMDVSDGGNSMLGLLGGGKKSEGDDNDGMMVLDRSGSDKEGSSRKRKRDSISDLLSWVAGVARNPCDPDVGSMPEKSKWKSYDCKVVWKQVLLLREAAFLKRSFESSCEQQYWQSQKMHPSLYDDHPGAGYNFRERSKSDKSISSGKSTPSIRSSLELPVGTEGGVDRTPSPHTDDGAEKQLLGSSNAHSGLNGCALLLIPLGARHQAEVPEWTGMTSESDSKWLGTRIYPSEKPSSKFLIERDPIGKGRQDSCGCLEAGSEECVRFHIAEKRAKVKLELGPAFHDLSLDKTGEQVRRLWTREEEKKFKDVVQSSSSSSPDGYFWDYIFRSFPRKSREDLVSYYYNVFLLQRRGHQNRHTPDDIDSDDDESILRNAFGRQTQKSANQTQEARSSILLTPKKPKSKGR